MSKLKFKLYIAGMTTRNKELITTFQEVCSHKLKPRTYQVDIIDILKMPADAEKNKILATPTILREKPNPERRIIGDFREKPKAALALSFLTEDLFKQK